MINDLNDIEAENIQSFSIIFINTTNNTSAGTNLTVSTTTTLLNVMRVSSANTIPAVSTTIVDTTLVINTTPIADTISAINTTISSIQNIAIIIVSL